MHSFGYRANALLTFAVTILALMCAMASVSDNFNTPTPSAQVQVLNINWFQKQPNGNDEVFVFLAAEYETPKNSLNQISLWDGIIPSKEHAKFWIHTSNKYRFIDQGSNLRGKEYNLTMHWHVMPKTGKMFADKIVMPEISKTWELPVKTLMRLTIPQPAPSQWSRFYAWANIALCPLALLYACNSFMPFNHPIGSHGAGMGKFSGRS
ncbi:hypothetical protein JHK82_054520 [Glycine max]|nr:hypothetical protein JHK82_054520 [Glycine max]